MTLSWSSPCNKICNVNKPLRWFQTIFKHWNIQRQEKFIMRLWNEWKNGAKSWLSSPYMWCHCVLFRAEWYRAYSFILPPIWAMKRLHYRPQCGKLHLAFILMTKYFEIWFFFKFKLKWRFPFDWRNPFGYLIAVSAQYMCCFYAFALVAGTILIWQ